MSVEQLNMLPIGTILHDTYRVEKYLSSGGFGNTYVVTNVQFEERLALKEFYIKNISQRKGQALVSVIHAENQEDFDSQLEKFKKEARRLHELKNENIVRVYDLFEENGTAYYVMDLIDGESLSAKMKRLNRSLTEAEVVDLFPQVLHALEDMHSQQIWHLDLKPGNIMIDRQGRAILIDFGASKQINASQDYMDTSSVMCYTPGYAPTEQIDGSIERIGPWTDFYALGATIYNVLTRQQPPSTTDIMIEGAATFQFPMSVSNDMRQLVIWLMEFRQTNRPQSVASIIEKWDAIVKNMAKELDTMILEIGNLIHNSQFKDVHTKLKQINKMELNSFYKNKIKELRAFLFRKEDEVEKVKYPQTSEKAPNNHSFDFDFSPKRKQKEPTDDDFDF